MISLKSGTTNLVPFRGSPRLRRIADTTDVPLKMPFWIWVSRSTQWALWRYRYVASFVLYGFMSILLEVVLTQSFLPGSLTRLSRSVIGFVCGLLFAFYMNARFNFCVPREKFVRTFFLFSLVSILSFMLNLIAINMLPTFQTLGYPISRFGVAALLFAIAYQLHRKVTFGGITRNVGLALYLDSREDLSESYRRVGEQIDHLHVDIVDSTIRTDIPLPDITILERIRKTWTWQPICLHIMSRRPLPWIEKCWRHSDCILVHSDIDDDMFEVLSACRIHKRLVGIVWHANVIVAEMIPYLPHVDFVMILGIEKPGHSGQPLMPEALEAAEIFRELSENYRYQVIFDGGITTENIQHVAANYVVSSSAVLQSKTPMICAMMLRSGKN